jgi:hypothetical protein
MMEPMATVVVQRIQQTHGWLLKVTVDLPDEDVARRFVATAPPIGWHLWHIARWADRLQASFPNQPFARERLWEPDRQIWFRDRLSSRWGLAPTTLGDLQTGVGMTSEDAAALPANVPTEALREYARRAFGAVDAAIGALSGRQLGEGRNSIMEQAEVTAAAPGPETTVSADLGFHLSHASRHLGCIEALRGLLDRPGTATM